MNSNRKKVALHTLGCKLNYTETSMIWQQLHARGYEKVNFEEAADVYIINTCSVTENADKECKRIVKKAKQSNLNSQVLITGCYAQLKPNEIALINGVNAVVGAKDKFRIADILEEINTGSNSIYSCDINDIETYQTSFSIGERTRAFLKVQDGCDYSCTYCTIPLARGKSRSDTIQNVVKQAEELGSKGIKEIVLSGVNIGDFGFTHSSAKERTSTLLDLIKALENVNSISRFRISSIEPNLLKDEIIEWVSTSEKFVPHFHIPLQSGSDKILKLMKRRYLSSLYSDRVNKIKSLIPYACIGADVIVGFPGESNDDFLDTYNFILQLDVSYLHVFTYSERDNTEASNMTNIVPQRIRQERNKMLRILSDKKKNIFYNQFIGTARNVLWEYENDGDYMKGLTDNYIRVRANYLSEYCNSITSTELITIDSSEMTGKIL